MGVLDDAIRQHLELKRQHGVPEEELRRQEEEALGPARRDVAPADTGDGGAAAEPELHDQETMLQEPEPAEVSAAEPEGGGAVADGVADREVPEADPDADDEPVAEADLVEPDLSEAHDDRGRVAEPDEFAFEDDPEEPPSQPGVDTLPSGFERVDDKKLVDGDELEEEDADVLEDTPDFLQETPEHDRLWFEQKPPRDFDFD